MAILPQDTTLTEDEKDILEELNKLRSIYPWVWCVEFLDQEVIDDGFQYLVANTEDLTWDNKVFKVFPFNVDKIPATTTGKFPSTKLQMFNTYKLVQTIERHNGFVGVNLILYFLNAKILEQFNNNEDKYTPETYPYKFPFKVRSSSVSGNTILFDLGAPNYLISYLPSRQYVRDFCPFIFKGEFCWMHEIADDIFTADAQLETPLLSDSKYQDCQKSYLFCRQYWRSATLSKDAGLHTHDIPPGIAFGGFPTVGKGDLKYY
jgi:phage-related protein